ncbi:MAG: hypothetical protein DWP95_02825 [Proteobacteria bacterium]|nr:MAG: hypothetical protein DWP95_02825 [Pseudomonadota bacterium]
MKTCFTFVVILMTSFAQATSLDGVLTHVYGDPQEAGKPARIEYSLTTEQQTIALHFNADFLAKQNLQRLMGQRVRVEVANDQDLQSGHSKVHALSVSLLTEQPSSGLNAVILGTKPWVSVLCKFNDRPDETEPLIYFQNMYANLPAGLDHYWREVSYDQVNIIGSKAFNWVTLPKNRDAYLIDGDPNLDLMFDDCIGATDALIDFSDNGLGLAYEGINMMFNDTFGCCAWGGRRYETLDGISKVWRVTWNPPWAIHTQGVIAHEMGHGFGLPHANNSDEDNDPYDSPWDVMSAASSNSVVDSNYGRLGKHINMSYKYDLGWVTDGVGFVANDSTSQTVTVEYTAKLSSSQPRFIRIPLNDGSNYFIEVRKKVGNYESNLPGNAVIIHHVDWGRNEPAWVVDGDNPAANFANTEGVMWKVGETFYDNRDGYQVTVVAVTTDGFQIEINGPNGLPDLIFADGFDN